MRPTAACSSIIFCPFQSDKMNNSLQSQMYACIFVLLDCCNRQSNIHFQPPLLSSIQHTEWREWIYEQCALQRRREYDSSVPRVKQTIVGMFSNLLISLFCFAERTIRCSNDVEENGYWNAVRVSNFQLGINNTHWNTLIKIQCTVKRLYKQIIMRLKNLRQEKPKHKSKHKAQNDETMHSPIFCRCVFCKENKSVRNWQCHCRLTNYIPREFSSMHFYKLIFKNF